MYDAVADPYCYEGTSVLRNIPGIRDQSALDAFEAISTALRADEPLPAGRLSVSQYRAVHHHLFQDVYAWAGRSRTVRMSKGDNVFCYPENIGRELRALFGDLRGKRCLTRLSPCWPTRSAVSCDIARARPFAIRRVDNCSLSR